MKISKEALAEVLDHVWPAAVNAQVSLLHHYSHTPIPKSLQGDESLPAFLFNKWRIIGPDRMGFDIAPHSIHTLRALGFFASPLQVVYYEKSIILKAAFAGIEGKLIELCIELTQVARLYTKTSFHIKGTNISIVRSDESPSAGTSSADGTSRDDLDDSQCHALGDTTRSNHPNCSRATKLRFTSCQTSILPFGFRRRTLVNTEYIIHVHDGSQEERTQNCMVRLLRIALEIPFATSFDRQDMRTAKLWLSIDISEEYEHEGLKNAAIHNLMEHAGYSVGSRDRDDSSEIDNWSSISQASVGDSQLPSCAP